MRVVTIVQARLGSTRLRGKALLSIGGKSILETIRTRVENSKHDQIWLATTFLSEDDQIAALASSWGWRVNRGPILDVLRRFEEIVSLTKPEYVVRLTADNPLVDYKAINYLIDSIISPHKSFDYLSDFHTRRFPIGYFPEIFRASSMLGLRPNIPPKDKFHLTHVTSYFYKGNYRIGEIRPSFDFPVQPNIRLTLDERADYLFLQSLYEKSEGQLT